MAYIKGDVVLVPFPFTDLRARKVRPAVILSSTVYHATEPDLILGAITTNLKTAPVDYVLSDWQAANLRFPSAFKPLLFTLAPSLILQTVGKLSAADMLEVDRRVKVALALQFSSLAEFIVAADLNDAPADLVQMLAERAATAVLLQANRNASGAKPERIRAILAGKTQVDKPLSEIEPGIPRAPFWLEIRHKSYLVRSLTHPITPTAAPARAR
jgi:mRNA interferase MazF